MPPRELAGMAASIVSTAPFSGLRSTLYGFVGSRRRALTNDREPEFVQLGTRHAPKLAAVRHVIAHRGKRRDVANVGITTERELGP